MAARVHRAGRPPRCLTPALAAWIVIVAAALGNITPLPVSAAVVLALLSLLALGHGRLHRRWRVAAPLALVAGIAAVCAVAGWAPRGVQTVYDDGPAGSVAVRAIWASAVTVTALDILWAWRLHARARSMAGGGERRGVPGPPARGADVRVRLDDLDRRITAVEDLLTRVP